MGLYRIRLKNGDAERIAVTMTLLGLTVVRVEQRESGTCYFYQEPKSKQECFFWIYEEGNAAFWLSGLSPSAKEIANGFLAAGLFVDEDVV